MQSQTQVQFQAQSSSQVFEPLENQPEATPLTAPDGAPTNFYNLTLTKLKEFLVGHGKEKFRAQQLFKWVYGERVEDIEAMSNLSKTFRNELRLLLNFDLPPVLSHLKSVDGTEKFLFDVGQGQTIEAVLIPSDDRLTLCLSSEVGCNLGCKFCFTGKQKLKRRLRADEIVGQFMQVVDRLPPGRRISNIVFMGMGEPLDNPDAVFGAIEILHDSWGMNVSRKRITVSTSGIVPRIPLVTQSGVRLAVSLNGSSNDIRSQVMPINLRYDIHELLEACREHSRVSRDKVTFEYVLLKGVTDSIEDARRLVKLTRDVPCKINIIPFNEHPGSGFLRPSDEVVSQFQHELMRLGAHVLLRKTMGRDIYAACGQLTSLYDDRPTHMAIQ
jgi:23S rRNA (adenine2503-C2)-methyltransferase